MSKLSDVLARLPEIEAQAEKATPGPWNFDGHIYIWAGPMVMVADTFSTEDEAGFLARIRGVGRGATPDEQRANGNLMAQAPDMAEALEEARALLEECLLDSEGWIDRFGGHVPLNHISARVREALGQ